MNSAKKCPNCGSQDFDEYLTCRYCGSRLKAEDGFTPLLTCPSCGSPTEEDNMFCIKCGFTLKICCPYCGKLHKSDTEFCPNTGQDIKKWDFFSAIKDGSVEKIASMVRYDKDLVCCKDLNNNSAIHYAAIWGNNKALKYFISEGADVNAQGNHGTPLTIAAGKGHYNTVRILLEHGADPFGRSKESSSFIAALDAARKSGNADLIELLINAQSGKTRANKYIAALLAFFTGGLGMHKFYLGYPVPGVIYLFFGFTLVPSLIGWIEGFIYLFQSAESFDEKHNKNVLRVARERWSIGGIKGKYIAIAIVIIWLAITFFFIASEETNQMEPVPTPLPSESVLLLNVRGKTLIWQTERAAAEFLPVKPQLI